MTTTSDEEITFIFIDTTNNDEETDEMTFPSDEKFDSILHDAAEQFGFESGAVVSGTENVAGSKDRIDRELTAGKTISILGAIDMTRSEVRKEAEKLGLKTVLFAPDNNYILAGANANQTQIESAKKLGASVLTEAEFKKLVASGGLPAPQSSAPATGGKGKSALILKEGSELSILGNIKMTRLEIRKEAEKVGVKIVVGVAKNYVIAGENANQTQLDAAKSLGATILPEDIFLAAVKATELAQQTQGKKPRDDDDENGEAKALEKIKVKKVPKKKETQTSPQPSVVKKKVDLKPFQGKTICFTGALNQMSRAQAKTFAESAGAKVTTVVSKNTNIVVCGANAGEKLDLAKQHGCTIMSEEAFKKKIDGDDDDDDDNEEDDNKTTSSSSYPKVEWGDSYEPEPDFDNQTLVEVESKLGGYKLPASYVALLKNTQNGGCPKKNVVKHTKSDFEGDIEQIYGISLPDDANGGSIVEEQENWLEEWEYPKKNMVYFACTSSGGHDLFAFCYKKCGKRGEPTIVHVEQEDDFRELEVASNFKEFMENLKSEDDDDDDDDEDAADDDNGGDGEDVTFVFLDTTNDDEESEEMEFSPTTKWDSVLHDAAEQFGFESGAVVSGTSESDHSTKIPRKSTAGAVFKKFGSRIRLIYTGPD